MKSKILIADDSSTIQKIIKITLATEDFDLIECTEEGQLKDLVNEHHPSLVLLDFNLSEAKTGYDLTQDIRDVHPSAKIIMLYGTFDTIDNNLNNQMNIDGHIVKPFDPTKFINLCKDVLADGESTETSAPTPIATEKASDPDATGNFEIGEEWVVNQPEIDDSEELATEDVITDQEKNQLEAGMEDWGMAVPNIIDQDEEKMDLPPVIASDESTVEQEEKFLPDRMDTEPTSTDEASEPQAAADEEPEVVPSDDDLEYPDMDEIKEQIANEPEPKAKLIPMDELNEDQGIPEEGIELTSTAGTATIEEVEALEEQIADEVEDENDIWSADEVYEDPDASIKASEPAPEPEPTRDVNEPARRRVDSEPQTSTSINVEMGEKTDPMLDISALKNLENINETVKEQMDPVIEKIAREIAQAQVEEILEKAIREEAQKMIEKVAWEIIPDLAENVIQEQLKTLADKVLEDS